MKANQTSEEIWTSIVTCLQAAHKANMIMSLRSRMNPHHPQDQQDQEIADAEQYSKVNWFLAKHVYFQHKDAMDALYKVKEVYNSANEQVLVFKAMVQVCEDEVSEQFEQQILKEDSMERKRTDLGAHKIIPAEDFDRLVEDLELDEELDEDELYAKETEGKWDGDDYITDEDDLDEDEEYDDEGEDEE